MKNLIFKKVLIYTAIGFLSYLVSCTKDTITDNSSNNSEQVSKNSNDIDFGKLNEIFETGEVDKIFNELMENKEKFTVEYLQENKEEFSNSEIDLSPINDYLEYRGYESIDVEKFWKDGWNIIKNEESDFSELKTFLYNNNIYSKEQLNLVETFLTDYMNVETQLDFENAIMNFEKSLNQANNLTMFEKNTLYVYSKFLQVLEDNQNEFIELRMMDCTDCIKSHKRKIFGWGSFFTLILIIGCILGSFGAATIFCIIGVAATSFIHTICTFCSDACSWC